MKIVDRKTFLAMPAGTLFSKYQPCVFDDLCIKEETLPTDDFLVQQLVDAVECIDCGDFSDKLHRSETMGESVRLDFDCLGHDGCFDQDQLFAVWEPQDVRALIERLARCLPDEVAA